MRLRLQQICGLRVKAFARVGEFVFQLDLEDGTQVRMSDGVLSSQTDFRQCPAHDTGQALPELSSLQWIEVLWSL
ncbi:MAG: hypothetical protein WB579_08810 [Bryobacteraceae bacterium]